MEKRCTRCEKETGIVDAVARTASRSFRRDKRRVDNSADAAGMCDLVDLSLFVWGKAAGGFLVASPEALMGSDAQAASRSSE